MQTSSQHLAHARADSVHLTSLFCVPGKKTNTDFKSNETGRTQKQKKLQRMEEAAKEI